MRVLSVASEVFPLIKTGGLADVVGALPAALKVQGVEVHTLVPGYPAVMAALKDAMPVREYESLFGGVATVLKGTAAGLDLLVVDAPHLYTRPGNVYLGPDGKDWQDNAQRFGAFSHVAFDLSRNALKGLEFDILHLHDWQAALAAVKVRFGGGPKTILTIHNIAFQGLFDSYIFGELGLPPEAYNINAIEYYGKINYLKGGIASATAITTVSPTYAEEICSPEFGMGLDGVIRMRKAALTGIVNGIDDEVWNPSTDKFLAKPYSVKTVGTRLANKRALEKRLGLTAGDGLIHGVVSRLTWQKGLDVLAADLDWLIGTGARLALIGTGEAGIEEAVADAANRHPGRIGAMFGYDEELSHQVQGGADTILVPSRFEPCGLTQLYGLRYGCVPVVAHTGGLADTVIDANNAAVTSGVATGVHIAPITSTGLQSALTRTARLYARPEIWQHMQQQGMGQDVSWNHSAAEYAALYRQLLT